METTNSSRNGSDANGCSKVPKTVGSVKRFECVDSFLSPLCSSMLAITLHFTGTSFRAAILTSRNTSCCFSPCHDPAHSQNNSRMTKLCKASLMQLQNITVPYLIALVKRDTCHTIHGQKIYPYHVVYCSRCFATQQTTHKSIVTIPVFITPRLNQLPLTGELVYH